MNCCTDLYALSAIACKIAECLTEEELSILAANLTALGNMLQVIIVKQTSCKNN